MGRSRSLGSVASRPTRLRCKDVRVIFSGLPARAPDRQSRLDSHGIQLAVHEWGDPVAPVLMLAHGGMDFARTFDVFAPLLADAGFRVVSWDQRCHGDSDHAARYSWDADVRDAYAVVRSVADAPVPFVGHSKGGGLMMSLIEARPELCSAMVNLDGVPSDRGRHHDIEPTVEDRAAMFGGWLDHRRRATDRPRRPGTPAELAERRARTNPRLSREWLDHLVTVGARQDSDGWRWKLDPAVRFGGFGPWKPQWALERMLAINVPFLAVLASIHEEMGFGTLEEDVAPLLPVRGRVVTLADTGHFVHIERPELVARLVIDFLAEHGVSGSRR